MNKVLCLFRYKWFLRPSRHLYETVPIFPLKINLTFSQNYPYFSSRTPLSPKREPHQIWDLTTSAYMFQITHIGYPCLLSELVPTIHHRHLDRFRCARMMSLGRVHRVQFWERNRITNLYLFQNMHGQTNLHLFHAMASP